MKKVCILAAGLGTRAATSAEAGIHKALLPLGNRATISRILNQFDSGTKFVIAVGFLADQIRDFISVTHPDLSVEFIQINPYQGPGSGPGLSLFQCKNALQEPFIFTACDTLVFNSIPQGNHNWIGVAEVTDPEKWCSAKMTAGGIVSQIYYRKAVPDVYHAFVGIAGVHNYTAFWESLEKSMLPTGEMQVNAGLEALIPNQLMGVPMTWKDTGSPEGYRALLREFGQNHSFDGKTTEQTYQYDQRIIKLYSDRELAQRRFERVAHSSASFPSNIRLKGHVLSYDYEPGVMLSEILNGEECRRCLDWLQKSFWRSDGAPSTNTFTSDVRDFYITKTRQRISKLSDNEFPFPVLNHSVQINGVTCLPTADLLAYFEPLILKGGLPSSFHGDLHADNIIVSQRGYVLIDWRDRFGQSSTIGDRYYDLAKFLHTLQLSVPSMREGMFSIDYHQTQISIRHVRTPEEIESEYAFWKWAEIHHYDADRISLINALVFLNMSPLYVGAIRHYLYALGRLQLQNIYDKLNRPINTNRPAMNRLEETQPREQT